MLACKDSAGDAAQRRAARRHSQALPEKEITAALLTPSLACSASPSGEKVRRALPSPVGMLSSPPCGTQCAMQPSNVQTSTSQSPRTAKCRSAGCQARP